MIKFFFNRFSKAVIVVEIAGVFLMCAGARHLYTRGGIFAQILFAAVVLEYVFLRFCAGKRWHRNYPRFSGVELHFRKAMVSTAYIMALAGAILMISTSFIPLLIAFVLLGFLAHVNVILLCLKTRDTDKTPPNFFSSGAFLRTMAP